MYKLSAIFLFIFIWSCSFNTEPKYTIRVFSQDSPKILLMPIDIEICELTIAGMCEPSASWTKNSRENIIGITLRTATSVCEEMRGKLPAGPSGSSSVSSLHAWRVARCDHWVCRFLDLHYVLPILANKIDVRVLNDYDFWSRKRLFWGGRQTN